MQVIWNIAMSGYAQKIVAKLSKMNDREAALWLALNYPIDEVAIALIIAVFRAAKTP